MSRTISLDTETTGLDFRHGTKPFLVTTCDIEGNQTYWEWDVGPLTRQPIVPEADLAEIQSTIDKADKIVLQNAKFDVAALQTVFNGKLRWDWSKVEDTLLMGHLLCSNQRHNLTTMVLVYLGINVQPHEDAIKKACNEARRLARSKYKDWRIAKPNMVDMPSAKGTPWKFDMWLPKVVANKESYSEDHPWRTLCLEYANSDSAITIMLYLEMVKLLKKQRLWDIYVERRKILPIVHLMEDTGVTLSKDRLDKLTEEYAQESKTMGDLCLKIAKQGYGYDLELPKTGTNKSLLAFVFDVMKLEPFKESKKTGAPSLDKECKTHYVENLSERSKDRKFIVALGSKSKRDTALTYMEGYRRFWKPIINVRRCNVSSLCALASACHSCDDETGWYRIHPSLNPTGTDTLRWSSSNPNEQNISKKEGFNLRYAFGPAPGREWWSLDYDNLELRIPAYESNEHIMIDVFEKPNDPPYFGSYHLMNAHIIYPELFEPLAHEKGAFQKKYKTTYYQWVKNFGFAISYGAMEQSGTADRAAHKKGAWRLVMNRLKEHTKLNQSMIKYANKFGYVETIPDKDVDPKRGYPLYCSRSNWGTISPTIPLNYHVQGTGCWIMMRAMLKVQSYLDQLNSRLRTPQYFMVMQVHDEMVLDFPQKKNQGNLPKIKRIQKLMASIGNSVGVPLTCGIDYHRNNWSESE